MVAKSWFLASEADLEADLAQGTVASATELVQLAQTRAQVGIGSALDVASASVSLQTYRDSLVQIALAREQSVRALELLLGRWPPAAQVTPCSSPFYARTLESASVPTGLPAQCCWKR